MNNNDCDMSAIMCKFSVIAIYMNHAQNRLGKLLYELIQYIEDQNNSIDIHDTDLIINILAFAISAEEIV